MNKELLKNKNNLSQVESYRISLDYGVVDLALAGDNYQLDIFGSTVNICSKINSSSLAPKNKIIIIVDDDKDVLFTYRSFLKDYDYHIACFTDPNLTLNYVEELSNFDDLLVILDIRMKDLNGFQLHQRIKSIDPTIKILFVTALDILDKLLSIVPGISKGQIMRKPVDKKIFTNTVRNMLG